MSEQPVYIYQWGNNPVRAKLKGRRCIVVARGAMNTLRLRFLDNGEETITSANSIRRVRE